MDLILFLPILLGSLIIAGGVISALIRGTWDVIGANIMARWPVPAIVGASIGVLLSIFSVIQLGLKGLGATFVLGFFGAVAFVIIMILWTVVRYGYPEEIVQWLIRAFWFVLVVGGCIGIYFFLSWSMQSGNQVGNTITEYFKFASPLTQGITTAGEELAKFKYCFYADPRCPFFVNWDNPDVQNPEEQFSVMLEFSENQLINDNVNVLASLTVMNPSFTELSYKPYCYYGNSYDERKPLDVTRMGSYTYGDKFIFESSANEQHTSFRCTGYIPEAIDKNIYSDKLFVDLERPVLAKTTWNIYIGGGSSKGKQKSTMNFKAPYSVALASDNDMPFTPRNTYDFRIVLKNQDENSKLLNLDYLTLYYPTSDYIIDCPGLDLVGDGALEIRDKTSENLRKVFLYSAEEDKYTLACTMFIINAPAEISIQSPISVETGYSVLTQFEGMIKKVP